MNTLDKITNSLSLIADALIDLKAEINNNPDLVLKFEGHYKDLMIALKDFKFAYVDYKAQKLLTGNL